MMRLVLSWRWPTPSREQLVGLVALGILCTSGVAAAQWQYGGKLIFPTASYGDRVEALSDGLGNVIAAPLAGWGTTMTKLSPSGSALWSVFVNARNPLNVSEGGTIKQLVSDGAGGAFFAWHYYESGDGRFAVALNRVNGAGQVEWGNGVKIGFTEASIFGYRVVPDESGGALVFSGAPSPASGIYVARLDSDGNLVGNAVSISTSNSDFIEDALTDGFGGGIVLWTRPSSGDPSNLYAQRVDQQGNVLWTSGGVPVCEASGSQSGGVLASDGAGGVFIAWADQRGSEAKIFAQRINGDGTVAWAVEGVRACTAGGSQSGAQIAADGTGNAVIVWYDGRNGLLEIFAQRVAASGALLWDPLGAVVCAAAGTQYLPRIGISSSTVFIAWADYRAPGSGSPDVYMQGLDLDGTALLERDGLLMSAENDQQQLWDLAIGADGPVAFWQDSGHSDPLTGQSRSSGAYAQGIIGEYYLVWGLGAARIQSVKDATRDQGTRVTLRWLPSRYDNRSEHSVTHYSVWRAFDTASAPNPLNMDAFAARVDDFESHGVRAEQTAAGTKYWEWLGDMDALSFDGYAFTASTLVDSTAGGPALHEFQVVTHSVDRFTYWKSEPMSGYSVDNLAPATPRELAAQYVSAAMNVHWRRNEEADLGQYRVYRGIGADFVPSAGNLLVSTQDTLITGQSDLLEAPWHVKVSAMDIHGNESGFALLAPLPPVSAFFAEFGSQRSNQWIRVSWSVSWLLPGVEFRLHRAEGAGLFSLMNVAVNNSGKGYWFEDHDVAPERTYRYRVSALTEGGEISGFEVEAAALPLELQLDQNRPNPFNPSTTIRFVLPLEGAVELSVFEVSGRLVRTLVNEVISAGQHSVSWDGRDSNGETVASGIYIYQLRSPNGLLAKKMVLLK